MRMTSERLNNLRWERQLGISTRGTVAVDNPDSVYYATMKYSRIRSVLDFLDLEPSDVFVDVGCGKGRVLCCAARHDVSRVMGIDLSAQLCREAMMNAQRMRGRRSPVTVESINALEFDYSTATVLFMFNPFGAVTMESVLTKVGRDTTGKSVRIAYATPTHAFVFDRQPWLKRYEFWDDSGQHGLGLSVAFYQSTSSN